MISDWTLWVEWFIKSVILIFALLGGFAYLTWYERRALARIQTRVGPNRAGPFVVQGAGHFLQWEIGRASCRERV